MTVSDSVCSSLNLPSKPCHNCRRRRLRCDRSLPGCNKCSSRREECLGYGQLLRWTNAVAVRGKVNGQIVRHEPQVAGARTALEPKTTSDPETSRTSQILSVTFSLIDPLLCDLGHRHRGYIHHFATAVCQDLVSFDQNDHNNPFRSTITLLGEYDFLREITLATSAIHLATLRRSHGDPVGQELADALAARGRAYRLLRQAVANLGVASQRAVVMIAIVFFINFDLIDSGQGSWMPHIKAAGNLVASIQHIESDIPPFITQLADVVVADSLTYHILGSALASAEDAAVDVFEAIDVTSTLQKAAVYSYHCCPPYILDLLAKACKLLAKDLLQAESLLHRLREFDVEAWVRNLKGLPSTDNVAVRVSVASAHRAAACLYVVLVVPDAVHFDEQLAPPYLVDEIFGHLSDVPTQHALAKGVIWPTFLAGAQAVNPVSRQRCLQRMQVLWWATPWICPWGYIESAILMLQDVWKRRDEKARDGDYGGLNWLQELRGLKERCLIV